MKRSPEASAANRAVMAHYGRLLTRLTVAQDYPGSGALEEAKTHAEAILAAPRAQQAVVRRALIDLRRREAARPPRYTGDLQRTFSPAGLVTEILGWNETKPARRRR